MKRRAVWLSAGVVFAVLLFKPAMIAALRSQDAGRVSETATNGRFAILLPRLFATRLHDEALYAARAHRVLTHGLPYDPYWRENRGLKDWIQGFPTYFVMAAFGAVAGGDMNLGWCLAVAVIGAAWFLLFEAMFFAWCGKREVSIPLALFSILFPDLYGWAFDVNFSIHSNLVRYADVFFQQGATTRPSFYRLPAGMGTLMCLALALLGAKKLAAEEKPNDVRSVLIGAALGLLFFVHAYDHALGLAALGAMAVASWIFPTGKAARRNLGVAMSSALVVSVLSAGLMSYLVDAASRADSLEIVGLERTHRFYWISLIHLLLASAGFWALKRERDLKRRAAWLTMACVQLAAFAARSSQVVTGFTVQPHHFIPLASFFACGIVLFPMTDWLAKKKWWTKKAAIAFGVLAVGLSLTNDLKAARLGHTQYGLPKDLEAGVDWIKANTPKDALVASLSMEVNEAIPLYTSASVMVPPASPPVSSLYTKEAYYRHVAELLTMTNADAGNFLAERWLTPREKLVPQTALADALRDGRDGGRENFERAEWFHPFLWGSFADEPVQLGRRRIQELARTAVKPRGPFYFWLDDEDRRFLKSMPEKNGGRLAFRNGSVSIYEFSQ